jgi:V8-like Glu-specific endopeptidase
MTIGLVAKSNIYVADFRVDLWPVPVTLQPIGMLRALPDDLGWGTAFLVGQCHILTAFHVAFPEHGKSGFVPSSEIKSLFSVGRTLNSRESAHGFSASAIATPVKWGAYHTNDHSGLYEDWAILELDDCLGRSFGFVNFDPDIHATEERAFQIHFAGFPQDRSHEVGVTFEKNCLIRDFGPGFLNGTDCAVVSGASGGPVFEEKNGNLYVIGIAIREFLPFDGLLPEYSKENRNLILLTEQFISELQNILHGKKNG